ncbi:ABC transporter substrate-binding protein [Hyphomicrobium sp. CS1BSMeth3]|uniref:ABC transporter substrate-binding protein n=1 Tax=Hyphomicrobium sp. CS1BSMeth3 TaxID=1892844 RepID=UPI000931327C|nr:ABC transporter substrate-binding protein [Hyphomicrobium sp. CS1BSMeth3]
MRSVLASLISAALCLGSGVAHAQISGDAVKIGVLNDQSGLYADFGGTGSVLAARMAAEDFGGTVLGKPIQILSADHQNKVDLASATARQWIDVEGVDAFADLTNSAVALAIQNLTKERNRIALFSGPATTRLTNEDCSPNGFHWTFDTYSQAIGSARAILQEGGKEWFLLVADYAFGHQMAADLTAEVTSKGGKVVGQVRHPTGSSDFSSFLLQAQGSKAPIIGLANGGLDTVNAVKQASEFGITDGGQKLVGLVIVITDVHAMGLKGARGLIATTAYYWDRDDASRAFAKRFEAQTNRKPGMIQAGVYSSVTHYLKAVQAAGTDEAKAVAAKMREMPVDDFFAKGAKIREDGRLIHDMYLVEVKSEKESKGPWDYYKILRTIPGDQAALPLSESKCPLVKK